MENSEFIVIGNWKLYKNYEQASKYLNDLNQKLQVLNLKVAIALSPALIFLALTKYSHITLFSQDVASQQQGPFTGQTSALQIASLSARGSLVGHSERRIYNFETNKDINQKIHQLVKQNLIAILCVGENLTQYEQKISQQVVQEQVIQALDGIPYDTKIIIAYEPIWAIGSGKHATAQEAETMCHFIKKIVEFNPNIKVLYGGSVNKDNVTQFAKQKHIDGVLVGGASLDENLFLELIKLI